MMQPTYEGSSRTRRRWVWALAAAALVVYAVVSHQRRQTFARESEPPGQPEAIGDITESQMPPIRGDRELARALWETFEKPSADANSAETAKLEAARRQLRKLGKRNDLDALLKNAVSAHQLHRALNRMFAGAKYRCLEEKAGCAVARQWRELAGFATKDELPIEAALKVSAVSIPNPAQDAILLEMQIVSGAPLDKLVDFMTAHEMIAKDQAAAVKARWQDPDATIGQTDPEKANLEKCLGVSVYGAAISPDLPPVTQYIYNARTGIFWSSSTRALLYPAHFNAARYPFDTTAVALFLTPAAPPPFSARLRLKPRAATAGTPLAANFSSPPRGFFFSRQTPKLTPVAIQPDPDRPPRSALLYVFQLTRRLETAVWRTFAPALMIVVFGFLATLYALRADDGRNHVATTIMASLLPTLTVAAVALQLTASAIIPVNVGGTVMDRIFVAIYVHIFCLFIALRQRHDKKLSQIMVAASLAPLAYGVHFFL